VHAPPHQPTPDQPAQPADLKPPLIKPRVTAATLSVAAPTNGTAGRCGAKGIRITASVAAGRLTVLVGATTARDHGAPAGFTGEIARAGQPAIPQCRHRVTGKVGPDGGKAYTLKTCSRCNACFKALGFNCSAPQQYVMSVVANKGSGAGDSPPSDEFSLNVTCAPGAERCR